MKCIKINRLGIIFHIIVRRKKRFGAFGSLEGDVSLTIPPSSYATDGGSLKNALLLNEFYVVLPILQNV